MKKSLLLISICLLLSGFGSAFAQKNYDSLAAPKLKPHFWFGPKVGVDLLTPTTNTQDITEQLKKNYQFGVFFQFGRKFFIQPEVYAAYRVVDYGTSGHSNEVTTNTLEVPLMFGFRLINLKVIGIRFMGGPVGSFLLKQSQNASSAPVDVAKNAFGLNFGAGVDVLGFITMDVRYKINLNDKVDEQFKNLNLQSGVNVTVGLKFR
jgi:hypothetical protein